MQNLCLCRIRDIYRAISAFEVELQRVAGLNINEAMLLCVLSEGDTLLSGEIAERLGLTRSNASKVIASVERNGLIRRQACPEDSRCQRFHITKKGTQALELMHSDEVQVPEIIRNIINTKPEEE